MEREGGKKRRREGRRKESRLASLGLTSSSAK
jgi:hypothetical protein